MWPVLANPKVAVALARIHVPHGCPVSEFSPDGMSTAKTGLLSALIKSMTVRKYPLTSDFNPVPSNRINPNIHIRHGGLMRLKMNFHPGFRLTEFASGFKRLRLAAASPLNLIARCKKIYLYSRPRIGPDNGRLQSRLPHCCRGRR